jgi:hypothetical protein
MLNVEPYRTTANGLRIDYCDLLFRLKSANIGRERLFILSLPSHHTKADVSPRFQDKLKTALYEEYKNFSNVSLTYCVDVITMY